MPRTLKDNSKPGVGYGNRPRRRAAMVTIDPPVVSFDKTNPYPVPGMRGFIRLKIKEVAVERNCIVPYGAHRGEANLSAIMRGTGLAWTTVYQLANNPDAVNGLKMETLARLCAFFQCNVGDILEYVQYPGEQKPPAPVIPIMNIVDEDDDSFEPVVSGVSRW
jgi:DNA-binding Xre family transcriptional regulator